MVCVVVMSKIPEDLRYTKSHEWVRVEGQTATVGITDHAQTELTDVVYVELPQVGKELKAGEACAVVESVKAASDIYAPLSGRVTEVNIKLEQDPGLVNSDPYGEGWFFKVELTCPEEVSQLLDAQAYAQLIEGES